MRTQIAAAVALGYFLGRTRKMKLAITIGGLLAGRRLGTDPQQLLRQGVKAVSSSPELSAVTDTVRNRLIDAAKSAATAAVSSRIDALGDSLSERAAGLRGSKAGEAAEQASEDRGEQQEEQAQAQEPEQQAEETAGAGVPEQQSRQRTEAPSGERRAPRGERPRRPQRPERGARRPSGAPERARRGDDDG